jgi:glycosyltransferase involved in cell wall biosynthesis
MRILWLTPELPYWPGGSGGSTRQFMLVRELLARGHAVDVVAPIAPGQDATSLTALGASLHAVTRPASRVSEAARAIRSRPRLLPDTLTLPVLAWQVEVFWTTLKARMRDAVDANLPDVILVEHDWAARWHDDLPAGVPTVLALENLSWRYYEQRATATKGPRAAALRLEAKRFKRFDRTTLPRYDALLAMSDDDARRLPAISRAPVTVIANGVDTAALTATTLPDEPTALFTGTFAYPPNAEALAWLLTEIWPKVRRRVPEARLLVVGKDPPAGSAGDGVELAGWVPEMQPWFDRARAVLVPIRSGAGTRLKVLDGLASGRPIVSTTMGAEGIAIVPGQHALIADDAQAFATAVVDVLHDDERAQRLGAAGRELAETVYDWRAIAGRLEAVLAGLAGDASARS